MTKANEDLLEDIFEANDAGYSVEFRPVPDGLLKCSIRHYGEVSVAEFHGAAMTHAEAFAEARKEFEKAFGKGKRK